MLWASFYCTVDGLTTVYFINNEVDLAVNEIMHQLQYQYQAIALVIQQEHMSRSTHVLLVTITIK